MLSILGVLCGLAGAAILVLMLQYFVGFAGAGAATPPSMWIWHVVPGLALLIGGPALVLWARRFPR